MAAENCQQIFDQMPSRFNADGAKGWNAVIQFKIAGEKGGNYVVRIQDGQCTTGPGEDPSPNTTITTDDATWMGMIGGTVNAMTAFTMGKLKVSGDMGNAMKLNNPAIFRTG